jgi:hypothetical protein
MRIPKFGEFVARDPGLFSLSLEGGVVAAALLSQNFDFCSFEPQKALNPRVGRAHR